MVQEFVPLADVLAHAQLMVITPLFADQLDDTRYLAAAGRW